MGAKRDKIERARGEETIETWVAPSNSCFTRKCKWWLRSGHLDRNEVSQFRVVGLQRLDLAGGVLSPGDYLNNGTPSLQNALVISVYVLRHTLPPGIFNSSRIGLSSVKITASLRSSFCGS